MKSQKCFTLPKRGSHVAQVNDMMIYLFHSWLREWKLRADREERRKQTEKKQGEDKTGEWQKYCSSVCLSVWFNSSDLNFQIQTGTVEKRSFRMERTCYAIRCSSQDPLGLGRLRQSMRVLRNWASRYKLYQALLLKM